MIRFESMLEAAYLAPLDLHAEGALLACIGHGAPRAWEKRPPTRAFASPAHREIVEMFEELERAGQDVHWSGAMKLLIEGGRPELAEHLDDLCDQQFSEWGWHNKNSPAMVELRHLDAIINSIQETARRRQLARTLEAALEHVVDPDLRTLERFESVREPLVQGLEAWSKELQP